MHIKSLYIQNFKGFEVRDFVFDPHFNVAIGNNATGKSTLLQALQVALGGYMQCLNIPSSQNYLRQFKTSEIHAYWDKNTKSYERKPEPTAVHISTKFSHVQHDTSWQRVMLRNNTTSHNKHHAWELMNAVEQLLSMGSNHQQILVPIVASFGTERTVAQIRKGKKAQTRRTRREKAFLAALSEKVDFDGVIEWLHNYEKELNYEREFEGTREALFNAIETAIPYLKNIAYNSYYQELEAEIAIEGVETGKVLHSNMSDGLKAMLNLVAELAFRCVILNGFLNKNSVKMTEGVVLIDELDMHLHPKWQMHVVQDLKNAFPKIQFIVTTHSLLVIQSLRKHELIPLEGNTQIEEDPFRKSIEEIAADEMGLPNVPRSKAFQEMEATAAAYYSLIAQGKNSNNNTEVAKLRAQLNDLETAYSDDPAFVALLKSERSAANL